MKQRKAHNGPCGCGMYFTDLHVCAPQLMAEMAKLKAAHGELESGLAAARGKAADGDAAASALQEELDKARSDAAAAAKAAADKLAALDKELAEARCGVG